MNIHSYPADSRYLTQLTRSGCPHQLTGVVKATQSTDYGANSSLRKTSLIPSLPAVHATSGRLPCASAPRLYPEEITLSWLQGYWADRHNKALRPLGWRGLSGSRGTALAGNKLRVDKSHYSSAMWQLLQQLKPHGARESPCSQRCEAQSWSFKGRSSLKKETHFCDNSSASCWMSFKDGNA